MLPVPLIPPPGLVGCLVSFATGPDFSECLVQGGERGALLGPVVLLASLPDQFGVVLLVLPWKRCLQSQKRECACGIQPLPGVGRRETALYPVQVPTVGRDISFNMGGRVENRYGLEPQLRNHGWKSIRTPFLLLNLLKALNFKFIMCWLVFIYFAVPFHYCDIMNLAVLKRELQVFPARSALGAEGFSDVHCMCQVLDKIVGVINAARRFLCSSHRDRHCFDCCVLL